MYERLIADLIVKGILLCSDSTAGGGKKKHTSTHVSIILTNYKNPAFIIFFFHFRCLPLYVTFYTVSNEYFGIQ